MSNIRTVKPEAGNKYFNRKAMVVTLHVLKVNQLIKIATYFLTV